MAKDRKPEGQAHSGGDADQVQRVANEIIWTLKRSIVIFKSWTMPITTTSKADHTHEDGVSARAFALAIIIALTFAVRGESISSSRVAFTALVGGLAAIISTVMNRVIETANLQQKFRVAIRERWLISAYASLIGVMFFFVLFQSIFFGANWYVMFTELFGVILFPLFLALVTTFVILLMKSLIVDGHKLNFIAVAHGLGVIFCCAILTFAISILSNDVFNSAMAWVAKK